MTGSGDVSARLEDYLEAIIVSARVRGSARVRDISKRLGVTSASVTGALRSLAEKSLIHYEPYEVIRLTPEGERLAQGVLRRHDALKAFFIKALGAEEAEAESAACAMEHVMSRPLIEKMTHFVETLGDPPRAPAAPDGKKRGDSGPAGRATR
jgi:DtxR family transcriptional regulator, Mn-dependent transcriptional regulator